MYLHRYCWIGQLFLTPNAISHDTTYRVSSTKFTDSGEMYIYLNCVFKKDEQRQYSCNKISKPNIEIKAL